LPKANLSYGIEWDLDEQTGIVRWPLDGPHPRGLLGGKNNVATLQRLGKILDQFYRTLNAFNQKQKGSRKPGAPRWSGELDITLMLFRQQDDSGVLETVAAGLMEREGNEIARLSKEVELVFRYGEGHGGLAFKTNRIRIYQEPDPNDDSRSVGVPTYYRPMPGMIQHRALVSFPVHIPVDKQEFRAATDIYGRSDPYAVLNIGSSQAECLMRHLNAEEFGENLFGFQHYINAMLATGKAL
jgi:hypothetical protein